RVRKIARHLRGRNYLFFVLPALPEVKSTPLSKGVVADNDAMLVSTAALLTFCSARDRDAEPSSAAISVTAPKRTASHECCIMTLPHHSLENTPATAGDPMPSAYNAVPRNDRAYAVIA